jgi:arylsulfatase A-like enzyme
MLRAPPGPFLAALLALLPCAGTLPAVEPKRPPNILVLIADDLGWRDVGYHGSEVRTPNLDRLARAGVRLERHYVYPTCSPTRAGLLTGRNPSRFGIHAPIAGRSRDALPAGVMTLAKLLRGRGYDPALVGKWHLGLRPEVGPRRYGFAHSYGYLHGQVDPYTHRYKNGDRTWHRDDVFTDEKGHATDLIAAEAVNFVSAKRPGPFFLWVAFSVPHHPLAEEERWLAANKDIKDPSRRLFAASLTHLDAAVGRIVSALAKAGQLDDTLILFTSDNGGQRNWSSRTEYGGRYPARHAGRQPPVARLEGAALRGRHPRAGLRVLARPAEAEGGEGGGQLPRLAADVRRAGGGADGGGVGAGGA